MELFEVDATLQGFSKETTAAYMNTFKDYMESFGQLENPTAMWEKSANTLKKMQELNTETFQKATELWSESFKKMNWTGTQEKWNVWNELMQSNMKAMTETGTANAALVKEMFN